MSEYSLEQPFGILNVHKPAGMTSRDVVNVIQRLVRPARCGHAGTLDPMATGVLLIGVGPATRLLSLMQERSKVYCAQFTLGQTSDTDDSTGNVVVREEPVIPTAEQVDACLQDMVGTLDQLPPAYSAVHVNGQRAYDLARAGIDPELQTRPVMVHSIHMSHYEWPIVELVVRCGSGTYIRSIARDLGEQLGCGGLMSRLERTAIGEFSLKQAVTLEVLREEGVQPHLLAPQRAADCLPSFCCNSDDVARMVCGKVLSVRPKQIRDAVSQRAVPELSAQWENMVMLLNEDGSQLLAIGERLKPSEIQPRMVFLKRS